MRQGTSSSGSATILRLRNVNFAGRCVSSGDSFTGLREGISTELQSERGAPEQPNEPESGGMIGIRPRCGEPEPEKPPPATA